MKKNGQRENNCLGFFSDVFNFQKLLNSAGKFYEVGKVLRGKIKSDVDF